MKLANIIRPETLHFRIDIVTHTGGVGSVVIDLQSRRIHAIQNVTVIGFTQQCFQPEDHPVGFRHGSKTFELRDDALHQLGFPIDVTRAEEP